MPIETEVKIPVSIKTFDYIYDLFGGGYFFNQKNIFYEFDKGFLRLRLEQEPDCPDRSFITLKGEKLTSKFNSRKELELFVGKDFKMAQEMLSCLGFRKIFEYSKHRVNYKSEGSVVSLDILSDDSRYVEIEGSEKSIEKNIFELGLKNHPLEKRSYLEILRGKND